TCLGVVTVADLRTDDAHAAWPPKPGDDLTQPANWPNDPGYKGTWQYFSWLPKSTGALPYTAADQKLGASGMSIDKAWTLSIGRPEVVIAEIDCGIQWDEAEIINKAWLNAKELAGQKRPKNASGACGGTGALLGYDCNGDGVFTVADYRDD